VMMKVVLLLVCLATIALASSDSDEMLFKSFMTVHNKAYSPREYTQRLRNFRNNLRHIETMQNLHPHATYGVDAFSDLSINEFKQKFLMTPFNAQASCQWPYNGSFSFSRATPPTAWDWRAKGAVTPVKNQAQCGSCWAFSTVANIEGQNFLSTGQLVSLSEQEIVDCSKSCLASEPGLCNGGCGGGLPWLAYGDVIKSGLTTEAQYPYTGMDGTCSSANTTVAAKISKWTALGTDVNVIQAYLVQHGPLSITMNANVLFSYTGGIITGTPGPTGTCPGSSSDHAITLVGYGTDPSAGVYWIVKNSWDTTWGEQGYFRIAATAGTTGESYCGINLCVTSASS